MIRENIEKIRENISAACEKYSRSSSDVTLIAVSKTMPVETLKEAYDCGIRDFVKFKNLFPSTNSFRMISDGTCWGICKPIKLKL